VSQQALPPHISLEDHIAWLESIGQEKGCTCRWAWKPRLYSWVRMNTERGCPAHGRHRED
jgi:hypothetical protein